MVSGWNQAIIDDVRGLALQGQPHQKHVYDTWICFLASNDQKISYITLEYFLLTQIAAIRVQRLYLTLAISAFTSQYDSLAPSKAESCTWGCWTS